VLTSEKNKAAYIVIDHERCKACYLCVSVCPKEIIKITERINKNGYTYVEVQADKAHECSGCKSCAIMCPDIAISVYRGIEPGKDGIA
jgi:2-oxoglutarate ferredoxin oxidoreductase subunit delta